MLEMGELMPLAPSLPTPKMYPSAPCPQHGLHSIYPLANFDCRQRFRGQAGMSSQLRDSPMSQVPADPKVWRGICKAGTQRKEGDPTPQSAHDLLLLNFDRGEGQGHGELCLHTLLL